MRQTYKRQLTAEEREAEIEATVAALPQTLDAETLARFPIEKNAIIYRHESRDRVRICCSCCGGTTVVQKFKPDEGCSHGHAPAPFGFEDPVFHIAVMSGDTCKCPMCYAPVKAVHIGAFKKWYHIDSHIIITFHVVRGHIAMLEWNMDKVTDEHGNVHINTNRIDGTVFVDGTAVLVKVYSELMCSMPWYNRWMRLKKFRDCIGQIERVIIDWTTVDRRAFEQSDMPNCALAEYIDAAKSKARPVTYLQIYLKHQAAENLVRSGMTDYFLRVMEECMCYTGVLETAKMAKYIDWKEVKPRRMTGFDKSEKWIANEYSLWTSEYYREQRACGVILSKDELDVLEKCREYQVERLEKWSYRSVRLPVLRVLRYLVKQGILKDRRDPAMAYLPGERHRADITTFLDYLEAVTKVYGNLPEDLIWPRNLITAHDEMIRRVKVKEDEAINAKIAELQTVRDRMSFRDEALGMEIFAARSQGELITEGKILHHCVARYATRHANGGTTILFIRLIDAPDTPFYTLEWNGKAVVQNRGMRNCGKTPEVQAFEDKWVQFMKEQEIKYGKHGKPDKRKKQPDRARAGA